MRFKVLAAALVAAVVLLAIILLAGASRPINATYPVPNAYDTVAMAAESMKPLPNDYDSSQDTQALNVYLNSNADAFQLIERALKQDYLIPLDSFETMGDVVDDASHVRATARLMFVQARLAELENRSADAADALAESIVLSHRSANGGLLIHELVSVASQRRALEGLMQLAPKLSTGQRIRLLKTLQAELAGEPSIDDLVQSALDRERAMVMREHGRIFGTWMIWQTAGLDDPTKRVHQAIEELRTNRDLLFQLLSMPNVPAGRDGNL